MRANFRLLMVVVVVAQGTKCVRGCIRDLVMVFGEDTLKWLEEMS